MEETNWLKRSISVSRIGDSAGGQAATRVNAEQASKMSMCRPTRRPFRGRLTRLGEMSEEYAQPLHRGPQLRSALFGLLALRSRAERGRPAAILRCCCPSAGRHVPWTTGASGRVLPGTAASGRTPQTLKL